MYFLSALTQNLSEQTEDCSSSQQSKQLHISQRYQHRDVGLTVARCWNQWTREDIYTHRKFSSWPGQTIKEDPHIVCQALTNPEPFALAIQIQVLNLGSALPEMTIEYTCGSTEGRGPNLLLLCNSSQNNIDIQNTL